MIKELGDGKFKGASPKKRSSRRKKSDEEQPEQLSEADGSEE